MFWWSECKNVRCIPTWAYDLGQEKCWVQPQFNVFIYVTYYVQASLNFVKIFYWFHQEHVIWQKISVFCLALETGANLSSVSQVFKLKLEGLHKFSKSQDHWINGVQYSKQGFAFSTEEVWILFDSGCSGTNTQVLQQKQQIKIYLLGSLDSAKNY